MISATLALALALQETFHYERPLFRYRPAPIHGEPLVIARWHDWIGVTTWDVVATYANDPRYEERFQDLNGRVAGVLQDLVPYRSPPARMVPPETPPSLPLGGGPTTGFARTDYSYGLPLRCLYRSHVYHTPHETSQRAQTVRSGSVGFFHDRRHYQFGVLPLPIGLAVNSGFWGFLAWYAIHGAGRLWRRARVRRGLCVRCGYDLAGSDGACAECGRGAAA